MMNSSARSLDVTDLNTPLMMSDFHMPNFMTAADVSVTDMKGNRVQITVETTKIDHL